ncbi:very-long-chain (3R)-3-hydroxyacyl-CoA dehydratase 4 isoform X2 [Denticeps clupeoides]|uniref:very-long-chain (3R)-3-hydroxyacyl-CoA dehydratase 4 isoform X2 n=1 Tax=Denticeps clupeoides TaxID=299321 RepID=UPI0010A2ADB8|nr:very-long-chain (3R)-3-hydroxyacyl-CoA dehydratase 4 isoform X2 [Denticeps clupeoides]
MRCCLRVAYLFLYNLVQFCGNTWIFANMTARLFSFGADAVADTFYFVGVVMSVCQLLSLLELYHIADSLEGGMLLPRFVQEEFQRKPIVCVQFYLWNIPQLLRYPYRLLSLISTPSGNLLWARYTLCIPVYILSVISEGVSIWQAIPYFDYSMYAVQLDAPVPVFIRSSYVLIGYLLLLAVGSIVTVKFMVEERKHQLDDWNRKQKKK